MSQYPSANPALATLVDGVDYPQADDINSVAREVEAIGAALRGTLQHDITLATGYVVKERGRSVAMGEWTTPAFSAGNFTASGSMTWTVGSGDVITYDYMLVGKTMTLSFLIQGSTVGGTPSSSLRIAVPASAVIARTVVIPVTIVDNGTRSTGYLTANAGATYVFCNHNDDANYAASTDNTGVYGQIAFEVE